MNVIREMIEETEILNGGIGVGHLIVDSPASSIRRTTSALLTSIKHHYDEDDVCIDCGYDEGERYMYPEESYAQKTNPTRMMLRSAERKGYENAIRDAIEVVGRIVPVWNPMVDASVVDGNEVMAAIEALQRQQAAVELTRMAQEDGLL
jgi:hypothetical protein